MPLLLTLFAFCISVQTAYAGTEPPFSLSSTLRLFWGLLIVLGILLVVYALVKKKLSFLNAGGGKGAITIVEMRHLMPRKSLCLIKVHEQEYLIGLGHYQINLIATLPPSPTPNNASPDNNCFAATLTAAATDN
jgi:flagellar protein FliO/FliZ